jgi:hypothetical protein
MVPTEVGMLPVVAVVKDVLLLRARGKMQRHVPGP